MSTLLDLYVSACQQRHVKPNSALRDVLTSTSNPTTLDLRNNYCGTEDGFDCLLEVLRKCDQLTSLDLSCNFLTTENVKSLVDVLLKHPGVRTVRLNDNRLYIESGKALVRLARFNPRIQCVDVTGGANTNKIPPRIVEQLNRELQINSQQAPRKNQ